MTETAGEAAALEPRVVEEEIPGTLGLGWYYSENKDEYQMARIAEKDRSDPFLRRRATGTGKTKFLEFLIRQDIEKGNGFGVIDPHGDLIEDIKGFLACHYHDEPGEEEVSERVILIDPTDPRFTVTFNPLEKLAERLGSRAGRGAGQRLQEDLVRLLGGEDGGSDAERPHRPGGGRTHAAGASAVS